MVFAEKQSLDADRIKEDFPILNREVRSGKKLVYLDSAATSQKPASVLKAMNDYYRFQNANIHRGVHTLAEEATAAYETSRKKVADFINAGRVEEVVFTRNTTEAINLVAQSWGRTEISPGETILLSEMEHHSNLIPWQMLAEEKDLRLDFIPVTPHGELDLEAAREKLARRPRLMAVTEMSNVLGTINPLPELIAEAHELGVVTLVDGAQSVPHLPVDVTALGADFYAFSAHKMCGPTGIGVLYGKRQLLEDMPPFLGGGEMIKRVQFRSFKVNDLPHKFEAGTPPIAEAIGLGAAVDYLEGLGMEAVRQHERELIDYALEQLAGIPGLRVFGPPASQKGGVASFYLDGVHPHDIAQVLDHHGVAVRAGHHCAQPLHNKFEIPATARASFYIYNTCEDVDLLIAGLEEVITIFG
jgi:cysteine desulfurase/selenocysteine lyase